MKNVVLILSDQHNVRWNGCYGADWVMTPNIDKLSERGITFDEAFCNSPLCAPARASLITGQEPSTHGALFHLLRRNPKVSDDVWGLGEVRTIGEIFRNSGYKTGCIGKLHVHGETPERDLGFSERGHRFYTYNFRDYIDAVGEKNCIIYSEGIADTDWVRRRNNTANSPLPIERKYMQDELTLESSKNFLDNNQQEPFLLMIGLEKPHDPMLAPEEFHKMYKPEDMPLPETRKQHMVEDPETFSKIGFHTMESCDLNDDEIAHAMAAYAANVSYADDCVGRIIEMLESRDLLKNTTVIYTSDHGELMFEHSRVQKHCFYDGAVQIPLIIYDPDLRPGLRCSSLVSLIDLMPTLCELNNLVIPESCEGISLLPDLKGERVLSDRTIYSEFHRLFPTRMVLTKRYKYCYHHECEDFLFDRKADPLEIYNIANHPLYKKIVEEMKNQALKDWKPLESYLNGDVLPEDETLNEVPDSWFQN